MKKTCPICPHHCTLSEGEVGRCRARMNKDDKIIDLNYGRLTSIALDPIEKKPLYRFYPNSWILSVGSFGCNLNCPFCQNFEISMADSNFQTQNVTPEYLAALAVELSKKERGNIGIAFTYNEPFISYEFVLDTAKYLHKVGLKSVLVTNGTVAERPLKELLPYIDAMNIDLKAFNSEFYDWIGGDFETVKRTIKLSAESCHVEVTTLIIPDKNDSVDDMESEAQWLASISPELPLHISRFFPRYKVTDRPPTDVNKIHNLVNTARKYLRYVYPGNC
ncbi:MAG: AmmeMemoRadiSam system radical SAM enzyme [Selenomonadaceae bacterium]|nr:AmmeMemoRadiSam system radical SAM enzyme [Selenomonadaceae bacterium]MBR1858369.1 AmmeMemoRadiSam system radical SAM enzyme [Selenomonadaceae bacterium]